MPLLCLLMDVKTAVPLCMLNSVVITSYLLFRLNGHLRIAIILPLCLASIPGIYVGTTFLRGIDSDIISICLGLLLATYSIYSLVAKPRPRIVHKGWGYVAGFLSGAIGSAFSAGGPPTIIYTTLNDWPKDKMKATLTGFFAFTSCLTAVVHALTGLTTATVLHNFIFSAPAVLVGTAAGSALYGRMPRESFNRLIFIFLIVMGCCDAVHQLKAIFGLCEVKRLG
jgi:hypothetical protein